MIGKVLAAGRAILTEPEAKAVLEAYGIPTVGTRVAADPGEAAAVARAIGFPVALKILSPDITHKSDVGGVRLDLADDAEVARRRRARCSRRVRAAAPAARHRRLRRRGDGAAPAGARADRRRRRGRPVRPVVLFGQGGTATEVIARPRDRPAAAEHARWPTT